MMRATAACAIATALATAPAFADTPKQDPNKPLVDLASSIGNGTWSCTGTALLRAMSATRTSRLEMSGVWMHDSVDAKRGNDPFHFEVYTSYDAGGKHFHRVMVESDGGIAEGEGHLAQGRATAGTAIDFQLDTHGPRGDGLFREHIDWSAAATTGVIATGELSSDTGKTWVKIYELTCKR